MMQETHSKHTFKSKVVRLAVIFLFLSLTTIPTILIAVYTEILWILALLIIPALWIMSPRSIGNSLPKSLIPPMSGHRLPYGILWAIIALMTLNLSGAELASAKALFIIVLVTLGMLIFIVLMSKAPQSKTDRFFDWLD